MAIGTLWSFQCIYLGIKKRKGKNFYHEPKLMNLLPTGGSTLLLVYDFMEAWKLGTDSVSNFNIILLGILVLSTVFVVFRSFLGGKKYTVYNIAKTDIEAILLQTLKKYELECKKEEKNPHSIVTKILLEQYDASVEMTQRGGSGTTFDLVFEKFDRVYNFEDIVADIKESINESTKVSRFRGVHEFAAAIGIVLFFVWMSIPEFRRKECKKRCDAFSGGVSAFLKMSYFFKLTDKSSFVLARNCVRVILLLSNGCLRVSAKSR